MTRAGRQSLACGTLVMMFTGLASAAELSYGVDAGLGYDDNVTRSSDNEQGETIATVGAQLSLDHESKRLNAKISSRLEYHDYFDNTYESDVVGNFLANTTFNLVTERFTWAADDTFGQSSINQFAGDTPANRENINVFSTGPDFKLPLGTRNFLVIGGRYSDVAYEHSDLGNDRISGNVALQRELSSASQVSLNATTEQVRFDDQTLYTDYDRNEAFFGYQRDSSRTHLTLEAGVTEIRTGGENNDDWLGLLRVSRQASPALTFGMELGHEFSDAGTSFVQQQELQPGSTDPVSIQQVALPFVNEYAELFGDFMRNRTGIELRLGFYDETYDQAPFYDRKRTAIDFRVQRTLSPSLAAHVQANYSHSDYTQQNRDFADLTASIGVNWQVGRLTSVDINYTYVDRSGDGSDYSSNQIWIRIGYLVGEGVGSGLSPGL